MHVSYYYERKKERKGKRYLANKEVQDPNPASLWTEKP
jgi:hypothetical protein